MQNTAYPADARVKLTISPRESESFCVKLRIPGWSTRTTVRVNGKPATEPVPGTYLPILREWHANDQIDIAFDFSPRFETGEEEYADKIAVFAGPLLYSYDARFNEVGPEIVPALHPQGLEVTSKTMTAEPPVWALADFTVNGQSLITVCDYASAGLTGTHYRSWFSK